MNIKFTVSKKYNHFFFVQTLADWHFSCRTQYAGERLREKGPLTEAEKESLIAFKSVMQKYSFNPIENSQVANAFDTSKKSAEAVCLHIASALFF